MSTISEVDFKCQRCGQCCKHRGDLVLTPMDVFQISKYLRISCEETVRRYTQLSNRHDFPQIVIQALGKQSTCIFYDNSKRDCTIYPTRPAQCYLFPLVPLPDLEEEQFEIQRCAGYGGYDGSSQKTPVLEWIKNSSTRYESEKELFKWYLNKLYEIDKFCHLIDSTRFNQVKDIMYCQYDLSEDMESQIRFNLTYKVFSL